MESENNPLEKQDWLRDMLRVVTAIGEGSRSTNELLMLIQCSPATLKRHIKEARHMGAQIQARQERREWHYTLANSAAVLPRCQRWLQLHEARSLLDA